jgi:lipoprotein signal peptidase
MTNYPPLTQVAHSLVTQVAYFPVTQVAHSLVTQVGNLLGGGVGNPVTKIHYTLVKPFCGSNHRSTVKGEGDTKPVTQVAHSLVTQVGNLLGGGVGNPVTKIHTIHIQGLK